jgi:hypothetical protein
MKNISRNLNKLREGLLSIQKAEWVKLEPLANEGVKGLVLDFFKVKITPLTPHFCMGYISS